MLEYPLSVTCLVSGSMRHAHGDLGEVVERVARARHDKVVDSLVRRVFYERKYQRLVDVGGKRRGRALREVLEEIKHAC